MKYGDYRQYHGRLASAALGTPIWWWLAGAAVVGILSGLLL